MLSYMLVTKQDNIVNRYELTASIGGIANGALYLKLVDYKPLTNNENTLTKDAIEDLLEW